MDEIKEKIHSAYNSIQSVIHINGGDIEIKNISDNLNIDVELSGLFHTKRFDDAAIQKIENLFKHQVPEINNLNFKIKEFKY